MTNMYAGHKHCKCTLFFRTHGNILAVSLHLDASCCEGEAAATLTGELTKGFGQYWQLVVAGEVSGNK